MNELELIRAKCIAVNPEIAKRRFYEGSGIRLADVLLAIIEETSSNRTAVVLESSGQFRVTDYEPHPPKSTLGPCWNLRADDLEKQSPETITFLAELLK